MNIQVIHTIAPTPPPTTTTSGTFHIDNNNNDNNNTNNNNNNNNDIVGIYWFRNALRLHDNPSLLDACTNCTTLLPIYIIDPDCPFQQTPGIKAGCIRANFILEAITEMNTKLQKLYNSQLIVVLGQPHIVLPQIIESFRVTDMYYEREPALPIRESDQIVLEAIRTNALHQKTVAIHGYDTHTIHPMESYLSKCKGHVAPSTYGGFTKIFQSFPQLKAEVKDVDHVPSLPTSSSKSTIQDVLVSTFGPNNNGKIPSLTELGYTDMEMNVLPNRHKGGINMIGGEDIAIQLLQQQMLRTQWVATFEKPNTSPNALKVDTTGLSPCTSVPFFWLCYVFVFVLRLESYCFCFPHTLNCMFVYIYIYCRCQTWMFITKTIL